MKNKYSVFVREVYSKCVDVYAENEHDVYDEIQTMEENGEIKWSTSDDFEHWEILSINLSSPSDEEKKSAEKWCRDIVTVTALIDPDWIDGEITCDDCMDWLENMRDNGVDIPHIVTSGDLWTEVLRRRVKQ